MLAFAAPVRTCSFDVGCSGLQGAHQVGGNTSVGCWFMLGPSSVPVVYSVANIPADPAGFKIHRLTRTFADPALCACLECLLCGTQLGSWGFVQSKAERKPGASQQANHAQGLCMVTCVICGFRVAPEANREPGLFSGPP